MPNDESFGPRPEYYGLFALVVGLYAAAVTAPAVTILLAAGMAPWQASTILLGNAALVTVLVGLAATRAEASLAHRLGRSRLAWGFPLGGAVYAGWLVATRPDGAAVALAVLGGSGGVLLGLVVVLMASNRAVRDHVADAPVRARWSATAGPRRRRLAKRFAVGSVGAGVATFVAGIAFGTQPLASVGQLLAPIGAGVYGTTAQREYAVLDEGLVVRAPANIRLLPWDRFESFAATDDTLVIHRREPWRLDVSCDVSEIEDVARVRDALATFLGE